MIDRVFYVYDYTDFIIIIRKKEFFMIYITKNNSTNIIVFLV